MAYTIAFTYRSTCVVTLHAKQGTQKLAINSSTKPSHNSVPFGLHTAIGVYTVAADLVVMEEEWGLEKTPSRAEVKSRQDSTELTETLSPLL